MDMICEKWTQLNELHNVIFAIGVGLLSWIILSIFNWAREVVKLRQQIKRRQNDREIQFRELEVLHELTEEKVAILNKTPEELIGLLQRRELKATQVLDAFISKSLVITRKNNCIIEYIREAKDWAKELDEAKEVKGPLHGLPISIKDNCFVKGTDSTLGLAKNLYKPKDKSSTLVLAMQDLGAIPFCKTNVPQTLLSYGCSNPIFGETTNFHNPKLSPGGSSGGEATLVAGNGSFLSIASDIGGSVRIPAHFSGVPGFKPTSFRLSPVGFQPSVPNVVGVAGVPGLIAKDMWLLKKVFQLLNTGDAQTKYDPFVLPLNFNEKLYSKNKKLTIGYFTNLDCFPCMGDTERVLNRAKTRLETEGHTLIPFTAPDSYRILEMFCGFSLADHGKNFLALWKYEPIPQSVLYNFLVLSCPRIFGWLIGNILALKFIPFVHTTRAKIFLTCGESKTEGIWKLLGERKDLITKMTDEWRDKKMDLLLCPAFPFPAPPLKVPGKSQAAIVYTILTNLIDFPSGVVPFGKESGSLADNPVPDERDFLIYPAKKGLKESKGMPIAVQLIGLPHQDELVLSGMRELERLALSE